MADKKYSNMPLVFGIETWEYVNPKYAKLVTKINSVGNMTLEVSPTIYPQGTLPPGVESGRIEKGVKVFDYDKKIIFSISFDDCVNVVEMSKKRFDWDQKTNAPVKPNTIKPLTLYRNSLKFNKKLTMQYVDGGSGDYYVSMNFESTDENGMTTKFKLPLNLESFDLFSKVLESYQNSYHLIQYYNQVQKSIDEKINKICEKLDV